MTVVVNSQASNWSSTTAATTQTLVPPGIVPGRSLIILMGNGGGGATGTITAVSDTGGNVYTLPNPPNGGVSGVTNTKMAAAYVHNCVAPGTITITSGSIGSRKVILLEVSGLTNTPHDTAAQDITAATALTNVAPAITLSQAGFAVAFVNRAGTSDPSSVTAGWTPSTAGLPDLTTPILRAAWQEFGAAGSTGTCGFTFAGTAQAGLGMIGFKVGSVVLPTLQELCLLGAGS